MKQHITAKQLSELSGREWMNLITWCEIKDITCQWNPSNHKERLRPLLSIGQMIEFLEEKAGVNKLNLRIHCKNKPFGPKSKWYKRAWIVLQSPKWITKDELVDALWEACKERLDNN